MFRFLAVATAVATYVLIVAGGVVKAYGAGLACPDWPLCHGSLVPPFDALVLLEWGHRVIASVVAALAIAAAWAGWRRHGAGTVVRRQVWAALILLAVQVGLGGLTVLVQNHRIATAAHLGTAMAFFGVWIVLGTSAARPTGTAAGTRPPAPGLTGTLTAAAVLGTWTLMVIGSYLKSWGGGLACADWPLCGGRLVPPFDHPLVVLHWAHRFGALVVGLLVVTAAAAMWRERRRCPGGFAASLIGICLFLLQAGLGAAAIFLRLSPPIIALHLAVASALFGALTVTATLARRVSRSSPLSSPLSSPA